MSNRCPTYNYHTHATRLISPARSYSSTPPLHGFLYAHWTSIEAVGAALKSRELLPYFAPLLGDTFFREGWEQFRFLGGGDLGNVVNSMA